MKIKTYFSIPLILASLFTVAVNVGFVLLMVGALKGEAGRLRRLAYFILLFCLYIACRKILQSFCAGILSGLFRDLRAQFVRRLFDIQLLHFEEFQKNRFLENLHGEIDALEASLRDIVRLLPAVFTVIGAFILLFFLHARLGASLLLLTAILAVINVSAVRRLLVFEQQARRGEREYQRSFGDLLAGFKELSLDSLKRRSHIEDIGQMTAQLGSRQEVWLKRHDSLNLLAESLGYVLPGFGLFLMPVLFVGIESSTLLACVVVLLFLSEPIGFIFRSLPGMIRARMLLSRTSMFLGRLGEDADSGKKERADQEKREVETFKSRGLGFTYAAGPMEDKFSVGPIDLEVRRGEVVFITGDNGSGQTTAVKLLTGLYAPGTGTIEIDGRPVEGKELGQYFSVFFDDFFLFEKFYQGNYRGNGNLVRRYLKRLRLNHKVVLEEDGFNTLDLFEGQARRLTLLRCFLEERPIYLFEEPEKGQDLQFREFFFRDLLPQLKENGKIVVVVTRDDRYVEAADRVFRMEQGKFAAAQSRVRGVCP